MADVPDPDYYAVAPDCTEAEFLAAARAYARSVVSAHDLSADVSGLEWEVSRRAKRRAGAVKHRDGEPRAVSLTWAHFSEHGWAATAATVRHELVHVHRMNEAGDAGHGAGFRALAEALDAPLTCERFVEPRWWVVCEDCGARVGRYRRSRLVEHPRRYRCGECGGALRVEAAG